MGEDYECYRHYFQIRKIWRNLRTKDIAFKFASWISVEFELYIVKEFQRLKQEEQNKIGWSAKRELARINYHIHTDAVRNKLVPTEVSMFQKNMIYAEEADVLNLAIRVDKETVSICEIRG